MAEVKTERKSGFALFNYGFRPFYLLGALFAGIIIPYWGLTYLGQFTPVQPEIPMDIWHAHEMLFGFIAAIVTGFLFTAVSNWTGYPLPKGKLLAAFCFIWIIARLQFSLQIHPWLNIADMIFMPCVTIAVAINIIKAKNYKNFIVIALILGLSLLNIAFYIYLNNDDLDKMRTMLLGAINAITILLAIIGGRVIPAFTNNTIPDASPVSSRILNISALFSLFALFLGELFLPENATFTLTIITGLAFVCNAMRFLLWETLKTLRTPLLWILHLGYIWILISLALKTTYYLGLDIPYSLSIHAVTIGAIGSLTLGMMVRSTKGHTGRPLSTHIYDITIFTLINIAALVRVAGGIAFEDNIRETVLISAVMWSIAFMLFSIIYLIPLTTSRADGKPG
ncbi:MAG: NnrS family protein [Methyloligellaceae bacterium]